MNKARAVPASLTGQVNDEDGHVLAESGDDTAASPLSRMLTVWRTLHLEIDAMGPEPTDAAAPERNFIDGQIKSIQGYREWASRFVLQPDSPPELDRLADGSPDADSPMKGKGRFENGTIRVGSGDRAQEFGVGENGLEYVEAPQIESGGHFALRFVLLDAGGTALCGGHVIHGSPLGGAFDLHPTTGSWSQAQASASWLDIAGVRYPVLGLGPTRLNQDNVLVGTATIEGARPLPFHLVDDDEAQAPFQVDTSLLQDSDDPNENVFAPAYIRPRILQPGGPEGYVDAKTAAFMRNIDMVQIGDRGRTSPQAVAAHRESREDSFATSPEYWLAYIQGAFQAAEDEDNDPAEEPATLGLTGPLGTLILANRAPKQSSNVDLNLLLLNRGKDGTLFHGESSSPPWQGRSRA